jgi:hypothetical protein
MPIRPITVGPPSSATSISASMAARHSGASCSRFGSFVMKVAASRRIMSLRPSGRIIGSSNARDQALAAISAASPFRQCRLGSPRANPGRHHLDYRLDKAPREPGSAAAACTRAIASPLRMSLADPSAIVAARANSHVHLGAMHTGDQPKSHLSGKGSSLGAKTSWLHGLQMQ